ncbi:MAG: universal stress protein [Pseudomonadota bacterium]
MDTSNPNSNASNQSRAVKTEDRIFLVVADDSEEVHVALHFACQRAKKNNGRIGLLSVQSNAEFHHWVGVGNLMAQEGRESAEETMAVLAKKAQKHMGEEPIKFYREGNAAEELVKLIDEVPEICIVILGCSYNGEGPGPIISHLMGKRVCHLPVPLTIVPGDLSDSEIAALG